MQAESEVSVFSCQLYPMKETIYIMLPVKFDFEVSEDRRSINFEGIESGRKNPEAVRISW